MVVLQLSTLSRNGVGAALLSWFLGVQTEQLFDEPDLTPNLIALHPPNLPLPDHIHRLISLNRSPSRVKFPEALLRVDPAFDRTMVFAR